MKFKHRLIVALAIALGVSVFFNIKILSANETATEQEKKISDYYGAQFAAITKEAGRLKLNNDIVNFIASTVMEARLESPYSTTETNRIVVVKKVVDELLSKSVDSLPEPFKIQLFLTEFVKYVPGSEFLSPEDYNKKYDYDWQKSTVIADIGEKFSNAVYFKFPKFLTDESVFSFKLGIEGMLVTMNMPSKLMLDLRGCGGDTMLGASLAECLYDINYCLHKDTRDRVFFRTPAELFFYRVKRPFDIAPDYKWQSIYFYDINPIFKHFVEARDQGIYFDRDTISIKRENEQKFRALTEEFNTFINSLKIFILVDRDTAGPAELFAALLKHKFGDRALIIGEPTKGDVMMQNIGKVEYNTPKENNPENGGGKKVAIQMPRRDNSLTRGTDLLGVLIITDSYWYNPDFVDCKLKDIHRGGITPDYLVFSEDGEETLMDIVKDLLNK